MYVDRDVQITGSERHEDEFTETYTLSLDLKQGWNRVVASGSISGNIFTYTEETRSEPSGIGWISQKDPDE
jgi:hypothetical protein